MRGSVGRDLRRISNSPGRFLACAHRGMTLEGLLRRVSAALPTQRTSPDYMRRRHDADGDGFSAPFASEDRLQLWFRIHNVSQFRRTKNECPVSTLTPDVDAVDLSTSNVWNWKYFDRDMQSLQVSGNAIEPVGPHLVSRLRSHPASAAA